MSVYVDVALPVAVDKTFTYLTPPELESSSVVGVRTIVPFGRRYVTGVIVHRSDSTTVTGLKPIRDILDDTPLLTPELLELCRWIADYYIAPLGEVLKTALPQGFSPSSKRQARSMLESDRIPRDISAHRRKILDLLVERGPLSVNELTRRTGIRTINAILNEMARSGYLALEEVLPKPGRLVKRKEFIQLNRIDEAALATAVQTLSPRKRRAREALKFVMELRGGGLDKISLTDLFRRSGVSSNVVKPFLASGLFPTVHEDVETEQEHGTEDETLHITLNEDQQTALREIIAAIRSGRHQTFLLHGVTGSGKTQVYIEAIRHCIEEGKSAIVLVPEISLTPQTVRRFNSHFPGIVAVVHSRMSQTERHAVLKQSLTGKYRIVIGPRSALFVPVLHLGLIVVDEEHEASYKQYDALPRYNARDAAIVRANLGNIVAILGSATPSLESYYNAETGKYTLLELPARVDNIPMPTVTLVDMREERRREYAELKGKISAGNGSKWKRFQQGSISGTLREAILDRLSRREGVILLQNRRGFAPFVECLDCGYSEACDQCSVTLTYHLARKHLRCHYCGTVYPPHSECPQCRGENLVLRGIGTQRVEEELAEQFPDATVLRMDLDTTSRKGAHERLLRKFGSGEADILLGTQMVAKGLDFPRVTLVGVISADTQMLLPDFRSAERTFQLLTQVAGRSGRSALSGHVIVQTHQPDHYTLRQVVDHDYAMFYDEEIATRKELGYPPFSRLLLLEFKGPKEEDVRKDATRFRGILGRTDGMFTLLGPSPAVIAKINNQYRWHLIIKIPKSVDPAGSQLRSVLRTVFGSFEENRHRSVRVIIDVDPVGMM